jgi:hypothetical protein
MKVFINGQSYDDWAQLPPEIKQQLAATLPDNDHNGIPDVFEGVLPTGSGMTQTGPNTFTSTSINVNGQQFSSISELPPELRQTLQAVFGAGLAAASAPPAPGVIPMQSNPAPVPGQVPNAPGVPAPGQVILNGQPVSVVQQEKKGLFKRLFGR